MAADPTIAAEKWKRNLSAAGPTIQAGVMAVTTAPTAAAAARADAYIAGVQNNVEKWKRNLQKVSLSDWQQAMVTKGLGRISQGATAAQPKMQAFLSKFIPYVEQGRQQLASMPKGDLQSNINRAVFMMNWNSRYAG